MTAIHPFQEETLTQAAKILLGGGVIIAPTDTVYGLLCHPNFPEAAERIRRLKHRDCAKPFQKLVASVARVWEDGAVRTAETTRCAAFWPGALTLVLNTTDGRTEGYRVPNAPLLRDLLERCGGLLQATSVNICGEPPADALAMITESIREGVDLILDGGQISEAEASAVVQILPNDTVKILRHGVLIPQMFPTP